MTHLFEHSHDLTKNWLYPMLVKRFSISENLKNKIELLHGNEKGLNVNVQPLFI
jgi:hypothetical protein